MQSMRQNSTPTQTNGRMAMKIYVTFGITDGSAITKTFDVPDGEHATYIGLEIDKFEGDDGMPSNRMTVMRQPFIQHGKSRIHTICYRDSDETGEQEW